MARLRLRHAVPVAVALLAVFAFPLVAQAQAPQVGHVVVLMLENHSFDSELGFWCAANPGRCTGMPATVKLADGTAVVPGTSPDKVPNVDHTVASQQMGLANNWDKISGCTARVHYACVSGYQPSAIPNLAALAGTYAVLDQAFTLHDAPSWGGHMDELAGTSGVFSGNNPYRAPGYTTSGPGWGCDAYHKVAQLVPVNGVRPPPQPSCIPDFSLGLPNGGAWAPTTATAVPTIMDEMDAAGVSWNIYATPSAAAESKGGNDPYAYIWSGCPSFAECLYTAQNSHLVWSGQFFTDAAKAALPAVSFLMPAGSGNAAFSQHNGNSNSAGDNWIGKVAKAVLNGPQGASSMLIVTYDDCGCFYDQVPPPIAPDGHRMGPRVPFVVAGPMVKPGSTDSTPTSSAGSILAFIEWDFGMPALGPNDARADNLSSLLLSTQPPPAAPHMVWRHLPASAYEVTADDDDAT
jgi:hypothetical protein